MTPLFTTTLATLLFTVPVTIHAAGYGYGGDGGVRQAPRYQCQIYNQWGGCTRYSHDTRTTYPSRRRTVQYGPRMRTHARIRRSDRLQDSYYGRWLHRRNQGYRFDYVDTRGRSADNYQQPYLQHNTGCSYAY